MTARGVVGCLILLTVGVGVGFTVLLSRNPTGQLWIEVGKGLIQLVVVGVMGTALTLVVNSYRLERERADKDRDRARERAEVRHQFRADKQRRLVAATNVLRQVPIMIEANRSVKSWSEQMVAAIGVGFELRAIMHEIDASATAPDPPVPNPELIRADFSMMGAYLDWLEADFRDHKKALSEQQLRAEDRNIAADERARRQQEVWNAIRARPPVADMIGDASTQPEERSWEKYERAYRMALDRMARAALVEQTTLDRG